MQRPLIALATLAIALLVARCSLRELRGRNRSVRVVNTTQALFAAFERRALEVGAPLEQPGLVRTPLDEELASLFYPANGAAHAYEYDPLAYSRPVPAPDPDFFAFPEHPAGGFHLRVNSLGLRENEEVQIPKPDLRVLVLGDSHTFGLCANEESFTSLLEGQLAAALGGRQVDALNAGAGYYNFFNYLGAYERLRDLAPDVVVAVAYGGNDFSGAALLERYFRARPPPRLGPWAYRMRQLPPGAGTQETAQVVYFLNNPEDEALAAGAATEVTAELARQCRERGSELLVAYLPPPMRAQPALYADLTRTCREVLGLEPGALECSDRLADAWLAALRERGIRTLDLRPAFRAARERLFWARDLHLDLAGQRLVARELLPEVAALLGGG